MKNGRSKILGKTTTYVIKPKTPHSKIRRNNLRYSDPSFIPVDLFRDGPR